MNELKPGVMEWLESIQVKDGKGWGRWKYSSAMQREFGLISSNYTLLILDLFGELEPVPQEQKQQAIDFIRSCYDADKGLIIDPLVTKSDRAWDSHSWEHIWAHMDAGARRALADLGDPNPPPAPPEKAPFHDLSAGGNVEWLLKEDWTDPWLKGEHFSKAVAYYWNSLPQEKQSPENPVITELFEALEQEVFDADTGVPNKRGCESPMRAMAGAFKLYKGYQTTGRELPYQQAAIDFVLDLQRADGSFGDPPLSKTHPLTIHWDSLWVLRELNQAQDGEYRLNDIRKAGSYCAEYLMKTHYKQDGAFSFYPDHCLHIHNSVRISPKKPISDVSGTMMSLRCMTYVDEWNA